MTAELELIGKQQFEIEELKKKLEELRVSMRQIQSKMVCIGGPLNDNKLGFNGAQLAFIHDIYQLASR